jgi:MFS superfamily sulfate permease-like transporter
MRLPLTSLTRGYERRWLRGDIVAGLTVWAVLVPEALAYASIDGVSPVVGLYAAPGALILYAAFGSSRHLVTGPMTATAALSAAAVGDLASQGLDEFVQLTITLGLVVGILALVAGVLRLGFLAGFISEPVLRGFIIGLALTIIVGQLPKLFGVPKSEGDFFEQLWDLLTSLDGTSGLTLLVGILSLALVVGLKEVAPVLPGSLVVVVLGIVAVHLFDLDAHGVEIVGQIESGLPSLGLPDVAAHRYLDIAPAAVGVMLVGFAESLGAAKSYAARNHYEIDATASCSASAPPTWEPGCPAGMVVDGSLSKTAVNASAGARSQLSGLVVAALTIVTLLFLTGLFEDLPEATLAAVVIAALVELVDAHRTRPSLSLPLTRCGPDLRGRGSTRLRRGNRCHAGRIDLRHAARSVHRDRRLAPAAALPRVASAHCGPWTGSRRGWALERSRASPPTTSSHPGSSSSDRRAGSSPPTRTPSETPSGRTQSRARGPWCSTPRPSPRSTSPLSACSPNSPTTCDATRSSSS